MCFLYRKKGVSCLKHTLTWDFATLQGPDFYHTFSFLLQMCLFPLFFLPSDTRTDSNCERPSSFLLLLVRPWNLSWGIPGPRQSCLLKGMRSSHSGRGNQTRMFLKASCVFLTAPVLVPTLKAPLSLEKEKYF